MHWLNRSVEFFFPDIGCITILLCFMNRCKRFIQYVTFLVMDLEDVVWPIALDCPENRKKSLVSVVLLPNKLAGSLFAAVIICLDDSTDVDSRESPPSLSSKLIVVLSVTAVDVTTRAKKIVTASLSTLNMVLLILATPETAYWRIMTYCGDDFPLSPFSAKPPRGTNLDWRATAPCPPPRHLHPPVVIEWARWRCVFICSLSIRRGDVFNDFEWLIP